MKSIILLVLGCIVAVTGNSSGPPNNVCESMAPGHGYSPQTDDVPYEIVFPDNKSKYSPGETITITLQKKPGKPQFKGFFIQPRTSLGITVGSIDLNSVTTVPAGANTKNPCSPTRIALSHGNGTPKDSVTLTWTAPSTDSGSITFVYTVVQSASVYWVRKESQALTFQDPAQITTAAPTSQGVTQTQGPTQSQTQPPTTTSTPTPTPSVAPQGPTTVVKDSGCGTDVGCYCKCDGSDCTFCLTWKPVGDEVELTFTAKQSGSGRYAAIGLSSDRKMGGDYVMAMSQNGQGARIGNFYNQGTSCIPFNVPSLGLTLRNDSYQNGVLYVRYLRMINYAMTAANSPGDQSRYLDLNKRWTLFYAEGPYYDSVGRVGKHTVLPLISPREASFLELDDITAEEQDMNLVYLHATFMVVAWIFLASFGIFTARYYKNVWPEGTEVCGEKRWFTIHRTCMVMVFLFTAAGFVVIFVHVEGYSEIDGTRYEESHPIIGIVVMALALLNPIGALLRPHPGTKYRPVFNFFHWLFGTSAHTLAIVNIFSGTLLSLTNVPGYIRIILYVFVGWIVVFELTFTILECRRKKDRSETYEMSPKSGSRNASDAAQQTDTPRQLFLILHGIVLLGFAAATVIIVWTQRDHDHDH